MNVPTWKTVELFGLSHVFIPGTLHTVCFASINPNTMLATSLNLSRDITCDECLNTMRILNVPTAQ